MNSFLICIRNTSCISCQVWRPFTLAFCILQDPDIRCQAGGILLRQLFSEVYSHTTKIEVVIFQVSMFQTTTNIAIRIAKDKSALLEVPRLYQYKMAIS